MLAAIFYLALGLFIFYKWGLPQLLSRSNAHSKSQESIITHRLFWQSEFSATYAHATVGAVFLTDDVDLVKDQLEVLGQNFKTALICLTDDEIQVKSMDNEVIYAVSVGDILLASDADGFYFYFKLPDNLTLIALDHLPLGLPLNEHRYFKGASISPTVGWEKFIPKAV